ncbi:hypothetical protein CALCODRAFT_1530 [Calocera cornea HHB12733]|uniref:Uncharacterized protein n=1 Tax=Calocera cornea HHB12733 TaxID=1353952 RepID=A0A165K7Z1_9BASI|nr:hypothetical protein CALCODRAFT_1530 [Calocera cornea HHB12733]
MLAPGNAAAPSAFPPIPPIRLPTSDFRLPTSEFRIPTGHSPLARSALPLSGAPCTYGERRPIDGKRLR